MFCFNCCLFSLRFLLSRQALFRSVAMIVPNLKFICLSLTRVWEPSAPSTFNMTYHQHFYAGSQTCWSVVTTSTMLVLLQFDVEVKTCWCRRVSRMLDFWHTSSRCAQGNRASWIREGVIAVWAASSAGFLTFPGDSLLSLQGAFGTVCPKFGWDLDSFQGF